MKQLTFLNLSANSIRVSAPIFELFVDAKYLCTDTQHAIVNFSAFSASTLLVECQEEHLVCKN